MKKRKLFFVLCCFQMQVMGAQTLPFDAPKIPSIWNIRQNLPFEEACMTGRHNYTIRLYQPALAADSGNNTSKDTSLAEVAKATFTWINKRLLCGRVYSDLYKPESPRYFIRDNKDVYYIATKKGKRILPIRGQSIRKTIRSGADSLVTDISYSIGFSDSLFYSINQKHFRHGRMMEWWQAEFPDKKFKHWDTLPEYRISRFDYQSDGMIKRTVMRIKRDSITGKTDTVSYLYHFISVVTDTENRLISFKLYNDQFKELMAGYYGYTGAVCTYFRLDFDARISEVAVLTYDDKRKKRKH